MDPSIKEQDVLLDYRRMGGRLKPDEKGASFRVFAPRARSVYVIGDFNNWDVGISSMAKGSGGVWSLDIPIAKKNDRYKFVIETEKEESLFKADPYAYQSELRPGNASVLTDLEYKWSDSQWIKQKHSGAFSLNRPINIYEVHLGSWMESEEGEFRSYKELGESLATYCKKLGFTHVELLPLNEHPFDQSWGYQVTGFFSVTSRYGSPSEFKDFVNQLHMNGIGVIIDWVPSHFPEDSFALSLFDGEPLFEHWDESKRRQPLWNTLMFDYARKEVREFLIQSALFWIVEMHIDGIRVDSVAAILYEDFADLGSESQNVCKEGVQFLKELCARVKNQAPHCLLIAEDASKYPGITRPQCEGGIGFDLKWNLGWMHDTVSYLSAPYDQRSLLHERLTFGLMYAFNERHALCLSHDEVSFERGSLWDKASPKNSQTHLRHLGLLYSYMMCYPGKKLFFMGYEIGDMEPWTGTKAPNWQLKKNPSHAALFEMIKKLNHLYLELPALWEDDFSWGGFDWVEPDAREEGVIVYRRKARNCVVECAHNFSQKPYILPVQEGARLLFCSLENQESLWISRGAITLPAESTLILRLDRGE